MPKRSRMLAVEHLVALKVLRPSRLLKRSHTAWTRAIWASARLRIWFISRSADSRTLRRCVGLGTLCLERGEVGLELLLARLDVGVALLLELADLERDLVLEGRQVPVTGILVDAGDHVGREVDDLLEVLRREVEQVAQAARHALEVPDVGDRGGELDVTHALTTHLGSRDLDAAALTDDALEAHALVLAAVALPVASRSEDLLAEQAILLGLERAVVDGLGFLTSPWDQVTDVLRGGQADTQVVEVVDVEHVVAVLLWVVVVSESSEASG